MMPAAKTKKAVSPKTLSKNTAEQIALNAARQALAEYSQSPDRMEHVSDIVDATVERAVEPAVLATFNKLGIDLSSEDAREALRKDMIHLRSWRELMEMIKKEGIGSVVKWVMAGFFAIVVLGIGAFIYHR